MSERIKSLLLINFFYEVKVNMCVALKSPKTKKRIGNFIAFIPYYFSS